MACARRGRARRVAGVQPHGRRRVSHRDQQHRRRLRARAQHGGAHRQRQGEHRPRHRAERSGVRGQRGVLVADGPSRRRRGSGGAGRRSGPVWQRLRRADAVLVHQGVERRDLRLEVPIVYIYHGLFSVLYDPASGVARRVERGRAALARRPEPVVVAVGHGMACAMERRARVAVAAGVLLWDEMAQKL